MDDVMRATLKVAMPAVKLMNSYERLIYNFIQRSIKYDVKEELNKPKSNGAGT